MRVSNINTKPFYKNDFWIRHLIIFIMAMFFAVLAINSLNDFSAATIFKAFLSNFILIASIWNVNVLMMNFISGKYNWEKDLKLKLVLFTAIAIFLPIGIHIVYNMFVFPIINGRACTLSSKENISYLIVSVVITLLINAIFIAADFFRFWKMSLTEKEELKRDSLSAEFEALKNQVNPHFLFNSLNTLSSLIDENPKQANEFVQKLASVYRYVLSNREKETVIIEDEIEFIKSYIFLNQIRFGKNLKILISVDMNLMDRNIPTLTLQMLIENAIKHNVISAQKPLRIGLTCKDGYLIVSNNLQPKLTAAESNGIGLNNIMERYKFLTNKEVIIRKTEDNFEVRVPVL